MTRSRAFILGQALVAFSVFAFAPRTAPAEESGAAEGVAQNPYGEAEEAPAEAASEVTPAAEEEGVEAATAGGEAAPVSEEPEPTGEPRQSRFRRLMDALPETGAVFSISRGASSLGLIGTVQLMAIPYIDDPLASIEAGSVANTEGFRLRRARLGITGDLPFYFGYQLLFQLGSQGANVLDAYVSFEPLSIVRVTAGALKVPFSGIMMLSSEYQTFLQRPYITRTVAPDRALGIEVSGQMTWFTYHVGVFNGGGDYYRGDNNAGMLYAIRLAGHPWGPLPDGEITLPRRFLLRVAASYFFNQDATGNRHAISAELAMRWNRVSFAGEVVWDTFDPAGSPETAEDVEYGHTERLGWYLQAGVFIIREHLQVAFRYEGQYVAEAVEIWDYNDLWAVSGAINGYMLRGRIKLSLQYEHRHEWFDEQVRNDFFGIQLQGRI